MNTCSTCKFWGDESRIGNAHYLEQKPSAVGMRDCENPELRAVAFGEGVEMEGIATRPDFGCIQHQSKE